MDKDILYWIGLGLMGFSFIFGAVGFGMGVALFVVSMLLDD